MCQNWGNNCVENVIQFARMEICVFSKTEKGAREWPFVSIYQVPMKS